MATSRIACIVVCMEGGPKTLEPQAIVIGTSAPWVQLRPDGSKREWADGTDWRYACYSLRELRDKLANQQDLLLQDQKTTGLISEWMLETSKHGNGMLTDVELDGLDAKVFTPAFLGTKLDDIIPPLPPGSRVRQTSLVARNVERVFFFSWRGGAHPTTPFAALDAARVADPAVAMRDTAMPHPFVSTLPAAHKLVGSRLVLFPDLSDPDRPGALAGLSLHTQIKVAANGHRVHHSERHQIDRHDTRVLFELAVRTDVGATGAPRSMWVDPDAGHRGMRFDRMSLRCTLGPFSGDASSRSSPATIENSDVLEFAYQRKHGKHSEDAAEDGAPFHVEALAELGIPISDLQQAHVGRTFGFRPLAFDDPDGKKITTIGWRFELAVGPGALVRRLFQHATVQEVFRFHKDWDLLKKDNLLLAQEQRLSDIALHLTPARVVTTVLTARLGSKPITASLNKDVTDMVLNALNDGIRRVHAGLKAVKDAEPISLLPRLHNLSAPVPWQLVGTVIDASPGLRPLFQPQGWPAIAGKPYRIRFTTFEPCARHDMWDTTRSQNLKGHARSTLPRLVTESRCYLCFQVELGIATVAHPAAVDVRPCTTWPAYQPAVSELPPDEVTPGVRLSVNPVVLLGTVPRNWTESSVLKKFSERERERARVLVQAMQFTFATKQSGNLGTGLNGFILFTPAISDPKIDGPADADEPLAFIDAVTRLPLRHIEPAAEDDLPRTRRSRTRAAVSTATRALPDADTPLLLSMTAGGEQPGHGTLNLSLTAVETAGVNVSHEIALSVRATKEDAAPAGIASTVTDDSAGRQRSRVLIIEQSPFRVAAIDFDTIGSLATRETNQVAVWNPLRDGGASWQVRDERQVVDLIYQPQAVGEAMEKNRTDLPGLPPDIQPGKPSAVRFGSLTVMKVDPTYADTAFREPGWNLRRIMGHAMQRTPGSRVLDLRLELLYGLLARVRGENLWITEIAGAIGDPPAPLPDTSARGAPAPRHLSRMNAVLHAEQRRLAVDKLWRTHPDEDLRLAEGVSFKVRTRTTNGSTGSSGPVTALRWPVPGNVPTDTDGLIDPAILQATFSTSPDDRDAFPGGMAWAFDSPNILMRVYGTPAADGGSLRATALTALGGFGSQRALFDERKTVIETEITLGRVQRYRLERIGRIACLWHRAKHVIVYERTVVPSAQFYNKPPIGLRHDEHLGRAIPRKVEEYIEILTPIRRYPEDGTSIREAGFVLGAEFKSTRIRVDSAWGSDVRREGWKVPLWNTVFLAASGDADNPDDPAFIYPMPQVTLQLAGVDGKSVPLEIADPEKLYFYTSVVKGEGDDTDLWQTVRDVDFCDVPLPQLARTSTDSADLNDAMLPSAPAIVPGYERFTLTLVPSNDRIALAHGRVTNGPLTVMRNVTVARAAAMPSTVDEPVQHLARELSAKAANVRAELDRRAGRILAQLDTLEAGAGDARTSADALIAKASAGLKASELEATIASTADQVSKVIAGSGKLPKLNAICDGIKARVRAQVEGQLNRIVIVAGAMIKSAALDLNGGVDYVAATGKSQLGQVGATLHTARQCLARLENPDSDRTEATRQAALAGVGELTRQVQTALAQLQANAKADIVHQVDQAGKRLASLPEELRRDLGAWREKTRADLGAVAQLVTGGLGGSGAQLVTLVKSAADQAKQFHDLLENAGPTLTQAVKAAASAFVVNLQAQRHAVLGHMAKVDNASLPAEARRLLQVVDLGMAAMLRAARNIEQVDLNAPLQPLIDPVAMAQRKLDTLDGSVKARFNNADAALKTLANTLESLLNDAFAAIDKKGEGLIDQLMASAPRLQNALTDAQTQAGNAIDALAAVDAAVAALLGQLAGTVPRPHLPPALKNAARNVVDALDRNQGQLSTALASVDTATAAAHAIVNSRTREILAGLENGAIALARNIAEPLDALLVIVSATCEAIDGFAATLFDPSAANMGDTINKWIGDSIDIANYEVELKNTIKGAIAAGKTGIAEIKANAARAAAELTEKAETAARHLAGSLQESLRDITGGASLEDLARRADGVYQKGDKALRVLTALGNPPRSSDGMDYNRSDVRFVMGAAKQLGVDMTPTLALVNRASDQIAAVETAGRAVGDLLGSFGVRLPTSSIGEALIPDRLKGLSVGSFFPDMAGIDLQGLLKEAGFPDLDDMEAIRFCHRVDEASMRVFMEADINVPFTKPVSLMSFGPIQIIIDTARFSARARMDGGSGGVKGAMNGNIFGDWRIVSGGQTILTFRQTGLYFDDSGKIDFCIQPDRIELAEALKFITDLMGATGQKGGLRIEPFVRGGVPSGVAATLDMTLPPIQTGAFGISDLSLHVMFGLAALPSFEIVSEMSIGMRTAPFTLNVWILNGGGYLMQRLSYLPTAKPQPLMNYTLEIGIVVGLGIGFSFGVVSGGVWVQIGCSIAFTWANQGTVTTMRVFLLVRGNVDVAGLITASINLLFEVSYDGARIVGAGTLTVRAKISMFYTLEVDEHVEYVFAGEKKQVQEDYAAAYC